MWKIAIIDDDRQVLAGMRRGIPWKELDAELAGEAMNGADGLDMIRRVQPDVIITDIYMPVMNGLDMISELRRQEFEGKIIILSGYSDFEYARQALRLDVSDYLSKPISVPTFKSVLVKALQDLSSEDIRRAREDEMMHKLMLYEPFVEKEWVKAALTGTLDPAYRRDELLPSPYLYWADTSHMVMGIELDRCARASSLTVADWNLFRFAVSNIVHEVVRERFASFEYTELHGMRSAVVLHADPGAAADRLTGLIGELGDTLKTCVWNYLKLKLRIGFGAWKSSWLDIPDSTEEAFRSLDGKGLVPDRKQQWNMMRPVKFYQELASAIKTSQETRAKQLVTDYTRQLQEQSGDTPEYARMLASELWGVIAYCLYDVGMLLDDLFPNRELSREMSVLGGLEQLAAWLTEKITVICQSREWGGSSKHRQAVDFMVQYIHEHYDEDITLSELADKVYISRNYLSNIFRNMTGETFNTYLTRVRMEKAKELLLERKMLVYEVAGRVGYKNVPYFSTLFKKFTGMNPTELANG